MTSIVKIIADRAHAAGRPLNNVNITIVGQVYRMDITYAGMVHLDHARLRIGGGPMDISVAGNPYDVVDIDPVSARDIIAAAWEQGAWDVVRTCIAPGYLGPLPPTIAPDEQPSISIDGHATGPDWPAGLPSLAAAARALGYTTWAWRPMLMGPPTRIKAFAHRDATLDPLTLTRSGPPPHVRIRSPEPGTQLEITLGRKP